jgi:hypothetical protein
MSHQELVPSAELFNFFNRANFGVPVRFFEAPLVGRAVNTVTPARRVHFSLKYLFNPTNSILKRSFTHVSYPPHVILQNTGHQRQLCHFGSFGNVSTGLGQADNRPISAAE